MVRIIKPEIVGHIDVQQKGPIHTPSSSAPSEKKSIRHSIYSIDIQPGGSRFATAGGDCSVRLWSLPALLSTEPDQAEGALLCSIANHVHI